VTALFINQIRSLVSEDIQWPLMSGAAEVVLACSRGESAYRRFQIHNRFLGPRLEPLTYRVEVSRSKFTLKPGPHAKTYRKIKRSYKSFDKTYDLWGAHTVPSCRPTSPTTYPSVPRHPSGRKYSCGQFMLFALQKKKSK
jgi:hypothetical protein